MKLAPFPSPRILVRRWENGEIEREEMQRLMAEHQYALLEEAEEVRKNPVASYVEGLMSKRAAKKLIRAHGEAGIRELLLALSEVENFLPSAYLWNAMHWDVPLYCFIRTKRAPIFRVKEMWVKSDRGEMLVEYGEKKSIRQESFIFERHWKGEMRVTARREG